MKFSGERFIPAKEGWLALQHYHRYYFSINQIDLKDKIVLDIACGEGFGSDIISRTSKFVYGVDISREAIEHAKQTYQKENLSFLIGDTSSIPLNDKSVDVVISFETIEHHDQHIKMMTEIKRVLNENGILIISSPDKGYYEKYYPEYKNEYHIKELYQEEFKILINTFFKHSNFFLQNNIFGSFIANEARGGEYNQPMIFEKINGTFESIEPRFNICMASDTIISKSISLTVCSDSINHDIFSIVNAQKDIISEQNTVIENLNQSHSMKIGKLLTSPLKIILKFLKW